jgi:hypothetical protein
MSADWWLMVDEHQDASFNLTYNLGAMLREAGWPTRTRRESFWDPAAFSTDTPDPDAVTNWDILKEGRRAADFGEMVGRVVANLEADPERFRALNPPNGWGNYDICLTELRNFLAAIEEHPNAEVEAWL